MDDAPEYENMSFQSFEISDHKPKSVHLHHALSTSDAIILAENGCKSKGENSDGEHLNWHWADGQGKLKSYMRRIHVLKDPACLSVDDGVHKQTVNKRHNVV